jgi:hypothetical protein
MKPQLNEVHQFQKIAGILNEAVEEGDRIKVVYGNEFYGQTGTVKEVRGGFITVNIDGQNGQYSMHMSDVEKIEDEDDDDDYDENEEPVSDYSKRRKSDDAAYYGLEEMEESESNYMEDPNPLDDVPSVKLDIDDNGTMRIELSALFHNKDNGKIPLLKDNPALQDVVMKAIQIESQKAFRKAVHGVLGIPYGLK